MRTKAVFLIYSKGNHSFLKYAVKTHHNWNNKGFIRILCYWYIDSVLEKYTTGRFILI